MNDPTKPKTPFGGIVLCGGKSTRMGRSKAWLPFGKEYMLQRVVRILSAVVSPIVVVAAREQDLPPLPKEVLIARDEYDSLGPLAGLAAGMAAIGGRVEAAYVSSCDAPLLQKDFVAAMVESLDDFDLVIPRDGKYHHPLAAVYRTKVEGSIRDLIAQCRLRPVMLFDHCRVRELDVADLRVADPQLLSLRNTNTPEDYAAALKAAGLESEDGAC